MKILVFVLVIIAGQLAHSISKTTLIHVANTDLAALDSLKFGTTSPAFKRFFGKSAKPLGSYLRQRITRFEVLEDAGIYAARNEGNGTVSLSPTYVGMPRYVRLSELLHEARHSDPPGWFHEDCPARTISKIDGKVVEIFGASGNGEADACDGGSAAASGAYAASFTFLMAVAQSCTNCDIETRRKAYLVAMGDLIFRILDANAGRHLLDEADCFDDPNVTPEGFYRWRKLAAGLFLVKASSKAVTSAIPLASLNCHERSDNR